MKNYFDKKPERYLSAFLIILAILPTASAFLLFISEGISRMILQELGIAFILYSFAADPRFLLQNPFKRSRIAPNRGYKILMLVTCMLFIIQTVMLLKS